MLPTTHDASEKRNAGDESPEVSLNGHGGPDGEFHISTSVLSRNLLFFTLLKTIGSFDSGAFSAVLGAENGIAEGWGLGSVQQGTLISSVFLGNILGCPLSGHLFSRYSAKTVLVWSIILHIFVTFLFATLTDYAIAILARFLIGITLSFVIVYTPVWVDEFAPRERQSVWMASHNAGVPLGIMLGYSLGAFLPSYTNIGWEWAFYIKCILTIPALGYLVRADRRSINGNGGIKSNSSAPGSIYSAPPNEAATRRIFHVLHSNLLYLWSTCVPLFCNAEYMCSTLAMCSLYFVVTGLQNFVTQYLRDEPFNASMKTIMLGFGGAVVTAPVLGVLAGGVLLDRIGGYRRNLLRVTSFTCAWGAAAASLSMVCIFVTDTMTFLFVISIVLFCGGAIIPPGSGTVMASVPPQLRPAGAALSQMMYNLLGNFCGPMVCGFVAEWTGELKYGIYTVLCCSVLGLAPMLVLLHKAYNMTEAQRSSSCSRVQHREYEAAAAAEESGEEVAVMEELNGRGAMKEESPRTATQDDCCVLNADAGAASITVAVPVLLPASSTSLNRPLPLTFRNSHVASALTTDLSRVSVDAADSGVQLLSSFSTDATPEIYPLAKVEMSPANHHSFLNIDAECMEESLRMDTDAAQMISFPSQHSFGLDMLRSVLSNSSHR